MLSYKYIFVFFVLVFICSCFADKPSSHTNYWYWSTKWYTAKPHDSESSSSSSVSYSLNTTYETSSSSSEKYPDSSELYYENLPFIVGIQAKKEDKKGELFLGNITDTTKSFTIYDEKIASQMDTLLTPLIFSSDCLLYVGINAGWNVYDWKSLNLLQQVQVDQTGLEYTPTTRGIAFENNDTLLVMDPYGRLSNYYINGSYIGIVGDLDLHGHASSLLLNSSTLYVGVHGSVLAYSYPDLVLQNTFSLIVDAETNPDSNLDVNSLSFYMSNSTYFFAGTLEGLYLINSVNSSDINNLMQPNHEQTFYTAQYYSTDGNSTYDALNGVLYSGSANVAEILKYNMDDNNSPVLSTLFSVTDIPPSKKQNFMRFIPVPAYCGSYETIPNNTTYPPVVGTYNQTSCSVVNLTSNYGDNTTILSCDNGISSFVIISQAGSTIVIQITTINTPSMKTTDTSSTLTIDATLTILGNIYFSVPLSSTSYAQCSGNYKESNTKLSLECTSMYSPASGATISLAKTTASYSCSSGSCALTSNEPNDTDNNDWIWITISVIAGVLVVGIMVTIIVVGIFYYKKKNSNYQTLD